MKKFLSLVLALVMTMSLVTVSAGAKDFTDDETITYSEAVAVVSEVGIVDGYPDGTFKPTNTLTRQAAAKIICNLILGPTTASELHANVAPYPDVPTTSEFAGYIAYCQQRGIISGYADGTFKPGNTLTGYAFMKMLLGALGYDSTLEGYAGNANWSINVAKQALGIGLDDSLELKEGAEFNGLKAVNREEACLYAFNTLQADLVEYGQRWTTNVNGTEVTLSSGGAQSKKWANQTQRTRIDNIREDEIIQFAEEYFRKLEKKTGDDEFMRPAYTWIYDKEEIGTYVDWTLLKEEYTTGVTGRTLYDLLGSALLNDEDMDLVYYVNGVEPVNNCQMAPYVFDTDHPNDGTKNITKDNGAIARNNQNDVGFTDDGVLTQVFVDKDNRESVIITSIDTWLAQGGADYNESSETAPIETWTGANSNPGYTWNVDVQDVPEVADVVEDDFYLITVSFKNDIVGEVVSIDEPEILEDSVVTKFSVSNITPGEAGLPTKLTTGGTEYKAAKREYYDPSALYDYDNTLLTDRKYNVFLDPYGYSIGIELNEGAKKYVFITGFDRPSSNLSVKTADAAAIFLDGTMQEIKVNVVDTDKKINAANGKTKGIATAGGNQYFLAWQDITAASPQNNGWHVLNRWYTYTVNDAGVYTLKPATNMVAYKAGSAETIKTANLYLDDNVMTLGGNPYAGVLYGAAPGTAITTEFQGILPGGVASAYAGPNTARCYGNDDSVYITVETDIVDTLAVASNITGVTGVYTGVQNVEIELDPAQMTVANNRHLDEADVYAVFDSNNYIVGAVTVGEGNGGNATIAYVTDGVQNERIEDGNYYWEFKAVVDGTVQTLTAKEKYGSIMNSQMDQTDVVNEADASHKAIAAGTFAGASKVTNWNAHDGIVELRFDADGYVVSIKSVEESKIYSYYGDKDETFGTSEYYGSNSVVDVDSAAAKHTTGHANFTIADAKAYRIGGIREEHVGAGYTWKNGGSGATLHHYDSAPQELTLVGRTLYVTPGQKDEGLALASDAKAVVIQRENGKWTTREFSNVSSAVSQVADADGISTNGKQYSGEVVAAMGSNGQAKWVVFTSYTDLRSGSGLTPGYRLSRISMTNGGVLGGISSWRHYKVGAMDAVAGVTATTNRSYVDITLVGTTVGNTYNVELQVYSTFTNSWGTVLNIPVTATALNTVLGTTTSANVNVGALNNGSLYRLKCGDLLTDTVEQALYV